MRKKIKVTGLDVGVIFSVIGIIASILVIIFDALNSESIGVGLGLLLFCLLSLSINMKNKNN
ncbi:MAG: hypothetical protein J6A17_03435 [Bacilli bacterium]|nr:hypothetical protein [Bacilli bacterium]